MNYENNNTKYFPNKIIDNLFYSLCICNHKGKIEYANKEFLNVFKYSKKEEILDKNIIELHPDFERNKIEKLLNSNFQNENFHNDFLALKKNEELFNVKIKCNIEYDESTNMNYYVLNYEIINQNNIEKLNNNEYIRLNSFLKKSPIYITFFNEDGQYLQLSQKSKELLNIPSDFNNNIDFSDIFQKNILDDFYKTINRLKKEKLTIIKNDSININNEIKIIKSYLFPLDISENNKSVFASIGIDITNQMKTEKELENAEKRFSKLFSYMNELVVIHEMIYNNKGDAINYKILDCNNAFTNITGIKKDEAVNKLATDLYKTEKAPYINEYDKVIKNKSTKLFETYYAPINKDLIISAVFLENNKFATITTDVSDIKKLYKELENKNNKLEKTNKELVKSNQTKINFLARVSHELRTPMNGILSGSRIIIKSESIYEIKEFAKVIYDSANRLLPLIENILDISKIEKSIIRLNKEDINLRNYLYSITKMFEIKSKEKNLNFNIYNNINKDIWVRADKTKLSQVINNVINNAIEYTDKGFININFDIENINSNQVNLKIKVQDTGVGINKNFYEKIFDPFEQEENFINRKHNGLGLGLAISKEIIELMKGKITFESEKNKGTIFYINICFEKINYS